MASKETWGKARHFRPDSPTDQWGDANAIDDSLIMALDDFRRFIQCPIHISRGVSSSGHSTKSFHYREQGACAVDALIPNYQGGPVNLLLDAMRFGFRGIGWYPGWKYKGIMCGGLHLDMRPLKWEADETLNYRLSRWIGIPQSSYVDGKLIQKQIYMPMNMENIIKYGGKYGHITGDLVLDNGKLPRRLN